MEDILLLIGTISIVSIFAIIILRIIKNGKN